MNVATAIDDSKAPLVSRLTVPGMHCAGCISKIENGLSKVDGVDSARVNFSTRTVRVEHDRILDKFDIKTAIAKLGFEAQALDEDIAAVTEKDEGRKLIRALGVSGFAMMNVMLLSVSIWSGADGSTRTMFHWISALIAVPAITYSGMLFFASAWRALRHGTTNMDVPISIGVILASGISLFETMGGGQHAYFESVLMLLFFLLAGRFLDNMVRRRARSGVTALLGQMADRALVLREDGSSHWINADALTPDMLVQVAAGERLAADGVVVDGDSSFDMSMMTGESRPVRVSRDDAVLAGTLNMDAPVTVRLTATGNDTTIADISRLMEDAGQSRSRYVQIADRAAKLYAPAVHSAALLSFAGWMLAGAGWHQSLLIAIAVLIITCPCALGLAVPVSQVVASGALMKRGILVKDGSALERLAEVDFAMFDKSGTLTLGRPSPLNLDAFSGRDKSTILALARASRHPLSLALRQTLEAEGVKAAIVENISESAGFGVSGEENGALRQLGRGGIVTADPDSDIAQMSTYFSKDGQEGRPILFSDALRPDAGDTLADLMEDGLQSIIISGDNMSAVRPVSEKLGITALASLTPIDKLAIINRHKAQGAKILMVGDGLNDGPALAAGHASIAPASASDAGRASADIVFLGDSLSPVSRSLIMARNTMKIVRQNFSLAIAYNIIAVPLAVAGFVTPLIAAISMSASSLIVVGNALRLRGMDR